MLEGWVWGVCFDFRYSLGRGYRGIALCVLVFIRGVGIRV